MEVALDLSNGNGWTSFEASDDKSLHCCEQYIEGNSVEGMILLSEHTRAVEKASIPVVHHLSGWEQNIGRNGNS